MISRRQTSGTPTCTSGRRRRTGRVSGNGYFAPLVTRLAAKHRMIVSQRRTPLSVINIANSVAAPTRHKTSLISEPSMPSSSSVVQGVSDEYVREKLSLFKDNMYAGLHDLRLASAPQRFGSLPRELQFITGDCPDAIPPTHMLALHASKAGSSTSRTQVTLLPVHEIVLSSHCANLPKLPTSSSQNTLPVVPLALPSPAMYPHLQVYLYHKNISTLESLLLPPLSTQAHSSTALLKRLLAVHGLWANATALGVVDAPLYLIIERARSSLHQALGGACLSAAP